MLADALKQHRGGVRIAVGTVARVAQHGHLRARQPSAKACGLPPRDASSRVHSGSARALPGRVALGNDLRPNRTRRTGRRPEHTAIASEDPLCGAIIPSAPSLT